MRVPRFTILQMLLAAALVALVLGLATSAWRTAKFAQITYLEYSPTGKYLAAKFSGGTIQVWDTSRSRPKLTAQFAGKGFLNFDVGPIRFADETMLVDLQNQFDNNSYSTMIRTMDLKNGRATLGPPIPFMSYAPSFAASRRTVALPNYTSGAVELYDAQTGKLRSAIKLPGSPWFLAMSDDEKYLAATDQNSGLHLIDLSTGKILVTKSGATMLAAVDISGNQLAAATWNTSAVATGAPSVPPGEVELVELPGTAPSHTIQTGLTYFTWLRLSGDGSRLAVADYSAFEYYDVASGKRLSRIVMRGDDLQSALTVFSDFGIMGQNLALAPDGKTLASFSGGQIMLRDLPSGKVRQTITGGWRSVQIVIFTLGFAGWAAAWGIVARRERLRREAISGPSPPATWFGALQPPPDRPVSPPPQPLKTLIPAAGWIVAAVVMMMVVLLMEGSWSIRETIGYGVLTAISIVAAVIVLAIGYSWLVRLIKGPHYLTLNRLRQVAHDQGRLHTRGQLTAAFFGPSNIEAHYERFAADVLACGSDLFGQPLTVARPTLVACLDRQADLDAYMLRHVPIAAVVPNVWTARLALVCEEIALRNLSEPADAFGAAFALLLTIQHKRGLLPGWVSTLCIHQMAHGERHAAGLRAAIRRQRILAVRRPEWDPRQVFTRTANQRAALWLAGDQPQGWREVHAEVDFLAALGELLLGSAAPAERRERVLQWIRKLRPKDKPLETFTRDVGLSLDELLKEWQTWREAQSGLPYDPLPAEKAAAFVSLHLPTIRNRALPTAQRSQAVRQVGGSGYVALAPPLIELLVDPRCEFRFDVIEALENLSGQPLGDNPAAWQVWFDQLPAEARAWPAAPALPASVPAATEPLEAVILSDEPAAPAATTAPAAVPPIAVSPIGSPPIAAPAIPRSSRPLLDKPPMELKLCWGLMLVGGFAALAIPISFLFLWGPLYFPTIYYALLVGVCAIAKGAARETLGLKTVAKMQTGSIVACDPINLLLGSMEFNLLNRPHVLDYLIRTNSGRL